MTTFGINNFLGNGHVSDAVKGFRTAYSNGARSPLHGLNTMLGSTHDALNFVKNFGHASSQEKIKMIVDMAIRQITGKLF